MIPVKSSIPQGNKICTEQDKFKNKDENGQRIPGTLSFVLEDLL